MHIGLSRKFPNSLAITIDIDNAKVIFIMILKSEKNREGFHDIFGHENPLKQTTKFPGFLNGGYYGIHQDFL